jgi:hypothetical protein
MLNPHSRLLHSCLGHTDRNCCMHVQQLVVILLHTNQCLTCLQDHQESQYINERVLASEQEVLGIVCTL